MPGSKIPTSPATRGRAARRPTSLAVRLVGAAALALIVLLSGCGGRDPEAGERQARLAVLKREAEGLRAVVGRLERGEPLMPPGDASVAITATSSVTRIARHLPLEADVENSRPPSAAEVTSAGTRSFFRGNARTAPDPGLEAQVDVLGALEGLGRHALVRPFRSRIAINTSTIEGSPASAPSAAFGLEEAARIDQLKVEDRLPEDPDPDPATDDRPAAVTRDRCGSRARRLPLR